MWIKAGIGSPRRKISKWNMSTGRGRPERVDMRRSIIEGMRGSTRRITGKDIRGNIKNMHRMKPENRLSGKFHHNWSIMKKGGVERKRVEVNQKESSMGRGNM